MFLLDSYGKSTNLVVRDMNGVEVEPGDLVEVKHCTGRYGQTQTVRGTFVKATCFGVYLTFDRPYTDYNGRYGSYTYEAGNEVQFAISHKNGVFFHEHNDFEHGHTTHMKKL
jgi:hypothetical protein